MLWIDTHAMSTAAPSTAVPLTGSPIVAFVINPKSIWDGSIKLLICDPMGKKFAVGDAVAAVSICLALIDQAVLDFQYAMLEDRIIGT